MNKNLERYDYQTKMGAGTYGTVWKAYDKLTKRYVAIKKLVSFDANQGIASTTLREVSILKELKNKYIVELVDVIGFGDKVSLVFELLDKDLSQYIDSSKKKDRLLDPILIKSYMYQIFKGMAYCHSHRVIHRDLKPANLLIDSHGCIKVGDFGLARSFGLRPNQKMTQEVVTLWYRAPEIILGCKYYGVGIDIWSIGCIFAEMCMMKPLFRGDYEFDMLIAIFKTLGTPSENDFPGVSKMPNFNVDLPKWTGNRLRGMMPESMEEEAIDLMLQCLQYDPTKRITAKQALNHPYFDDLDKSLL